MIYPYIYIDAYYANYLIPQEEAPDSSIAPQEEVQESAPTPQG